MVYNTYCCSFIFGTMKPQKSIGSTPDPSTRHPNVQEQSSDSGADQPSKLDSVKKNLSWAKDPKAQAGVAAGLGSTWMFFFGALPAFFAFFLTIWLIVSGARAEGGAKKNWWIWMFALIMLGGAFIPEFTGAPKAFRNLEGTERVVPEVLRDDRGGQEQSTTRGEVVETVTLPPATQLPTTWTFSSGGRLEVEGSFTIQVTGVGLITFDPTNGDRTLPGGKTVNSPPVSNKAAFPDPTRSWGMLLIRPSGGEWVQAQGFVVTPGGRYELALNVNQVYRRYVQYRPDIRVNLYSE